MPLMRLTTRIAPSEIVDRLPADLDSGALHFLVDPTVFKSNASSNQTPGKDGGSANGGSGGDGVAPPATTSINWLMACYGTVGATALMSVFLWHLRDPSGFTPGTGISVFAPLYILAQAIERLLDPLTSFVTSTAPASGGQKINGGAIPAKTRVKKADAILNVNNAISDGDAQRAADWQAVVDQIRKNTAMLAWTAATTLALLVSGAFGLYMMRMVGFAGVPKWIDILITGLAVGSGTKPLHDLISNLQSSAQSKQDPAEKQAA